MVSPAVSLRALCSSWGRVSEFRHHSNSIYFCIRKLWSIFICSLIQKYSCFGSSLGVCDVSVFQMPLKVNKDNIVLLAKLIVAQLVKKFTALNGIDVLL